MKKLVNMALIAGLSYLSFSAGRIYEIGRLVVKGVKFLADCSTETNDAESSEDSDAFNEPIVRVVLTKEEYELFKKLSDQIVFGAKEENNEKESRTA